MEKTLRKHRVASPLAIGTFLLNLAYCSGAVWWAFYRERSDKKGMCNENIIILLINPF